MSGWKRLALLAVTLAGAVVTVAAFYRDLGLAVWPQRGLLVGGLVLSAFAYGLLNATPEGRERLAVASDTDVVVIQGSFWALTLLSMCVLSPGASPAGAPLSGSLGVGVVAAWFVATGALFRRTGWPDELSPAHWVRQYREGNESTQR